MISMHDSLLFSKKQKEVPFLFIQKSVVEFSKVSYAYLVVPDRTPLARKREYAHARQISMTLCHSYTKMSLERIGQVHGGRDHATVLHAVTTINNLLDTKDDRTIEIYKQTEREIKTWLFLNNKKERPNEVPLKKRIPLIKVWIKNKVPLEIRERLLFELANTCTFCGQVIKPK